MEKELDLTKYLMKYERTSTELFNVNNCHFCLTRIL